MADTRDGSNSSSARSRNVNPPMGYGRGPNSYSATNNLNGGSVSSNVPAQGGARPYVAPVGNRSRDPSAIFGHPSLNSGPNAELYSLALRVSGNNRPPVSYEQEDLLDHYGDNAFQLAEIGYPLIPNLDDYSAQDHLPLFWYGNTNQEEQLYQNSIRMGDIECNTNFQVMPRNNIPRNRRLTLRNNLRLPDDPLFGHFPESENWFSELDEARFYARQAAFQAATNGIVCKAADNFQPSEQLVEEADDQYTPTTVKMGWQASKNTLKERLSFLYCSDVLADVYFVVGSGSEIQKIPAHKFILVVGSAVFDAMFNGCLAEKTNGNLPEITLPDVEPPAFLSLLKFLYTDDVSIGPDVVMATLYTAKKYGVPALETACVEFLKRNLCAENAFMLLTQARLFDEPQLAKLCLDMIDNNAAEAMNAEGFTEIDSETLCLVFKRDTLRVREGSLFLALLRWSVEECHRRSLEVTAENQRTVMGKALEIIRFPLMSIEEFAQNAAQTGIMTDREIVDLFLYFTVSPKPQIRFIETPRRCVFGKEAIVSRFERVEGRWGYSGTPDRIKFTVDRNIFVIGFGLYGSVHGPHEYKVLIQIVHCGTGKVLASNDTSFSCDGSNKSFRVMFKDAVEIDPSVTYIASASLRGPDSHYGTKGLRRIIHRSISTGVVTFQFTYAADNNNGTSVEDGQIPEIIFCTKLT